MAETGMICQNDGTYRCKRGHRKQFTSGDVFTRCRLCKRRVKWSWVDF